MIMLWNSIWCRTKCCHSSKFQHPALTISHPQILPAEGQALCLQSKWELWGCNPSWLQQELRHLGTAESCLQHAVTPLQKDTVGAELLLGRSQQFSAASQTGICPWGSKTRGGRVALSSATPQHPLQTPRVVSANTRPEVDPSSNFTIEWGVQKPRVIQV